MNQAPAAVRFTCPIEIKDPSGAVISQGLHDMELEIGQLTVIGGNGAKTVHLLEEYLIQFDLYKTGSITFLPRDNQLILPTINISLQEGGLCNNIIPIVSHWLFGNGENWQLDGDFETSFTKILVLLQGMCADITTNYGKIACEINVKPTEMDMDCIRVKQKRNGKDALERKPIKKLKNFGVKVLHNDETGYELIMYEMCRKVVKLGRKAEEIKVAARHLTDKDMVEPLKWIMACWACNKGFVFHDAKTLSTRTITRKLALLKCCHART